MDAQTLGMQNNVMRIKDFQYIKYMGVNVNIGGVIMNKSELVTAMVEKTGLTKKDTEKAIKAFEEVVTEELTKGEKVQLVRFRTFDVKHRAEREGRNPKTEEKIIIPATNAPKFKAGKALKDSVNGRR